MVFMLIQWAAEMDTNMENSSGTLERLNVDGVGKCRAEEVRGPQRCSILSL